MKKTKRIKKISPLTAALSEILDLKNKLSEASQTLRAIQRGEVDALVMSDGSGEKIFTLKSADQPYRVFVETMNEGAATVRIDGTIFYCNQKLAELLKTPLEEIIGNSIYNFISDTDKASFEEFIKVGKRGNMQTSVKPTKGPLLQAQISVSPTTTEEGKRGVCVIVTDLTTRMRAEEELKKSHLLLESRVAERTAQLAKAVKVRDDFLSMASHELKTPLTSLKLQAQMRMRKISKREADYFHMGKIEKMVQDDEKQINRLTRLVDDMLDLSRITSGKLSLEVEPTDICQVIREVVERLSPQFQASETKVNFESLCPIVGQWDRYRIEQIFTNLLTNALRYGRQKPIDITVKESSKSVKLEVIDHGIGIAKADQTRIFGQFERAISVNEVSGLGLGLYIVKQLTEAHGGTVSVSSKLGKGSTFEVKLPLKQEVNKRISNVVENINS